jgi:hypothetical protein
LSGAADSGSDLLDRRPPRATLVTMLSLASGVADAISFLYLGGVFTSVITGTLVVLGLSVANGSGSTVAGSDRVRRVRPRCARRTRRRGPATVLCRTGLATTACGDCMPHQRDGAVGGDVGKLAGGVPRPGRAWPDPTTGTRRLGDGNAERRHAQPRASRSGHHLSDRCHDNAGQRHRWPWLAALASTAHKPWLWPA